MGMQPGTVAGFFLVLWCLMVTGGCASGPKVGSRAPSFSAIGDNGEEISLAKYEGKVLVLYFWATWCAPCAVSGPAMQTLQDRYGERSDVALVGVHYDNQEDPEAYNGRHGYTYDIVADGRNIVADYGIKKIPSFVIIGPDGTVLFNQVGFANGDEKEFEHIIESQFEGRERQSHEVQQ
jgi:peroxiredoxin